MKVLQVLSATAAAGKTVWAVGLARALREAGFQVSVFKAVSEDVSGYEVAGGRVSLAALHLMAAAGRSPNGIMNPVLMVPVENNLAEVWLRGRRVGEVARLGRDISLLDDLNVSLQEEIMFGAIESLKEVSAEADIVIAEGAGGATDLTLLGAWDLANVTIAAEASTSVMVARASKGGALASLAGTVRLLDESVRPSLRGVALNDVRHRLDETVTAGRRIASELSVEFLGATPWLPFFEGRGQHAPFTRESDEDHMILAQSMDRSISMTDILEWMNLAPC
jgi:adenosylcobyric acid synthase